MDNYEQNQKKLSEESFNWYNMPTVVIRVPKEFQAQILEYARQLALNSVKKNKKK